MKPPSTSLFSDGNRDGEKAETKAGDSKAGETKTADSKGDDAKDGADAKKEEEAEPRVRNLRVADDEVSQLVALFEVAQAGIRNLSFVEIQILQLAALGEVRQPRVRDSSVRKTQAREFPRRAKFC